MSGAMRSQIMETVWSLRDTIHFRLWIERPALFPYAFDSIAFNRDLDSRPPNKFLALLVSTRSLPRGFVSQLPM